MIVLISLQVRGHGPVWTNGHFHLDRQPLALNADDLVSCEH